MNTEQNILLIDDDVDLLLSMSRTLKELLPNVRFHFAGNAAAALTAQKTYKPNCAVVDLELEPGKGPAIGLELISSLLAADADLRIIVLTGHRDFTYGVEAVQRGAVSFQEKPAQMQIVAVLLTDLIKQYILRIASRKPSEKEQTFLEALAGKSTGIEKVKDEIRFAASTNQSIFLAGESGVGKSLCAKLIHTLGTRSSKRFIRYQPSYVSADLVNSDLFGHVKGSFTGATTDRSGILAEVDGGTLFIDEVDSLPIETQVLLLGVLQDRTYRQIGSVQDKSSNFRLITAANGAMDKAVQSGRIRKDFYYRIAHQVVSIPSLRERIKDIPLLAENFLKQGHKRFSPFFIARGAMNILKDHHWPGNIRELQSVIEGAAYRAQYQSRFEIQEADIQIHSANADSPTSKEGDGFHDKVLRYKKKLIREALFRNDGNQVQTAKDLGLDRSSMRRIIADEL